MYPLVADQTEHSKINIISPRAHVLFPMYEKIDSHENRFRNIMS